MGNSQSNSIEDVNSNTNSNKTSEQTTSKININSEPLKSILKNRNLVNNTNLPINKVAPIEKSGIDEPQDYHKHTKKQVDSRINDYQYFHEDPVYNYDFNSQVGIQSKNDTRFQNDINNMYESELNNRDLDYNDVQNATKVYKDKVRAQVASNIKYNQEYIGQLQMPQTTVRIAQPQPTQTQYNQQYTVQPQMQYNQQKMLNI